VFGRKHRLAAEGFVVHWGAGGLAVRVETETEKETARIKTREVPRGDQWVGDSFP
jgi:hypothetical protein